MVSILRRVIAVVALAVGLGVAAGTAPAVAATTHTIHSNHSALHTTAHKAPARTMQAQDWWF
jgi:hypothetical protein